MIINNDLINNIFYKNFKLTKDQDKQKLSNYQDIIPMYDIYSERIYPIEKENLYYRLINCHYRFINHEITKWIENKYKKNKIVLHKKNLDIISNYIIDILLKTSYETLYKFSNELGLLVSICKRNSFNKYSLHLKPYYSKDELLKLGYNMDIIKPNDNININDEKIHYDICKKISKNDVSYLEIEKHSEFIIKNKLISYISFYSFTGSFYMNDFLRNNVKTSNFIINNINNLSKGIISSPPLKKNYYLYRFIWNDDFMRGLKINDIFIDKGFLSTTRDPFYSPGLENKFGLILFKIKISPKENVGLLIENFSLFPKEEEFLLPPGSKFKLLSKNDNFKYYHINKEFEKVINKKYELEYIPSKIVKINTNLINNNYKKLDYNIELNGIDKLDILRGFIREYKISNNEIQIINNNKKYRIYFYWIECQNSSYSKFYYNKNDYCLQFFIYENNYPYLNIEFGDYMVVNYINKYYYYDEYRKIDENDIKLLCNLAYIFKYTKFILFLEMNNFSEFTPTNVHAYSNMYCKSIYNFFKHDTLFYNNLSKYHDFFNYKYGYWKLKKLKKTEIPDNIKKYFKENKITSKYMSEFIIEVIEKYFYFYNRLPKLLIENNFDNFFDNDYIEFDIISYFKSINIKYDIEELKYDYNNITDSNNFKIVFKNSLRRIN